MLEKLAQLLATAGLCVYARYRCRMAFKKSATVMRDVLSAFADGNYAEVAQADDSIVDKAFEEIKIADRLLDELEKQADELSRIIVNKMDVFGLVNRRLW